MPGRRPAGYWYKTEQHGRGADAAASPKRSATTLPLVNLPARGRATLA